MIKYNRQPTEELIEDIFNLNNQCGIMFVLEPHKIVIKKNKDVDEDEQKKIIKTWLSAPFFLHYFSKQDCENILMPWLVGFHQLNEKLFQRMTVKKSNKEKINNQIAFYYDFEKDVSHEKMFDSLCLANPNSSSLYSNNVFNEIRIKAMMDWSINIERIKRKITSNIETKVLSEQYDFQILIKKIIKEYLPKNENELSFLWPKLTNEPVGCLDMQKIYFPFSYVYENSMLDTFYTGNGIKKITEKLNNKLLEKNMINHDITLVVNNELKRFEFFIQKGNYDCEQLLTEVLLNSLQQVNKGKYKILELNEINIEKVIDFAILNQYLPQTQNEKKPKNKV